MVFTWKMPFPATMLPCWLCQQCCWQHIIQMYLWWNLMCYKLYFRGSCAGPYNNAFRLITGGQVFQINLSSLTWICTVFLEHWEAWGSAEWGKKQESCPHLVLSQACNGAIRRWSPLGGQEGLRAGLSYAGTPSAPWAGHQLGIASPDPGLRLHVCSCVCCWTLIDEQTPVSVNEPNQARKQFSLWQSLLERKNRL